MKLDTSTVANLATRFLPLSDWGFTESTIMDSRVIYNSQWCRIMFYLDKQRNGEILRVYYGRLHAQDNEWNMEWNNEECHCWYGHYELQLALYFLDGFSPQEVFRKDIGIPHLASSQLFQDYLDSESGESDNNTEERFLKLHLMIWERYGVHFFELFDLRYPDLWERYIAFMKEFYNLRGNGISLYNPKYC